MWFTGYGDNTIGRITPDPPHTITEFALPTPGAGPVGITVGPDGNLWFTEFGGHKIGRISPGAPHTINEFPLGGARSAPPAWLRYARPAAFEAVVTDVGVPVRDGTELHCTLVRPGQAGSAAPGRFPGLVMDFVAYRASQDTSLQEDARWFAERGYAVLLCSPRERVGHRELGSRSPTRNARTTTT